MDDAAILSLPDDPALLKRMLAERTRERDEHRVARQSIELHIQQIQSEKQNIEQARQAAEFKLLRVEVE